MALGSSRVTNIVVPYYGYIKVIWDHNIGNELDPKSICEIMAVLAGFWTCVLHTFGLQVIATLWSHIPQDSSVSTMLPFGPNVRKQYLLRAIWTPGIILV